MRIDLSEEELRMIVTVFDLIEKVHLITDKAKKLRQKIMEASVDAHFQEAKKIIKVKIRDLKLLKSVRVNGPSQKLIDSIKKMGQMTAIIIDKDNTVIDGQMRVQVLKALGKKTVIALRKS